MGYFLFTARQCSMKYKTQTTNTNGDSLSWPFLKVTYKKWVAVVSCKSEIVRCLAQQHLLAVRQRQAAVAALERLQDGEAGAL